MDDAKEKGKQAAQSLRVPVPNTNVPFVGHVDSLALKKLICGTVAGGVSGMAAAPFEFLRSKALAGKGGTSVREVFSDTLRKEGIEFVKKGSLVSGIMTSAVQRGVMFFTYEAVKRREENEFGRDVKWLPGLPRQVSISTVAGAVAAFVSTLATYPMSTVGDRMFLKGNEYNSTTDAISKIIRKEGIGELYRGLIPKLIRMVPDGAASFFTYETLKKRHIEKRKQKKNGVNGEEIGTLPSLCFGAIAGLVSTTLSYPLDNITTMMSMQELPKGGGALESRGTNIFQTLKKTVAREGVGLRGLYRGVGLRYAEIIPVTALAFLVYELAKRVLIARHKEKPHEFKG